MKKLIICFILIVGMLLCTSCQETYKKTNAAIGAADQIKLAVESNTCTFDKAGICLDLYIGTYDKDLYGNDEYKGLGGDKEYASEFIIFINDGTQEYDLCCENDTYESVVEKGYIPIRVIEYEAATSEEFGYTKRANGWASPKLNHRETIEIPSEVIKEGNNSFVISIHAFGTHGGKECMTVYGGEIKVDYHCNEDGIIELLD